MAVTKHMTLVPRIIALISFLLLIGLAGFDQLAASVNWNRSPGDHWEE